MIHGKVDAHREARVHLDVIGPDHRTRTIQAVVDTGFNGYLTLPEDRIEDLGLHSAGRRRATLGDGSTITLEGYYAMVLWHDGTRDMTILCSETEPLVGMAMLDGSRLTMDVIDDGDVCVEKLS